MTDEEPEAETTDIATYLTGPAKPDASLSVDSAEADIFGKPEVAGNKRILMVTPTYDGKEYCADDFFKHILALEIPEGVEITWLIMENTTKPFYVDYWEKINTRIRGLGMRMWTSHIVFNPELTVAYRLATVYNICRGVALGWNFDYMFTVEADVMLNPGDLKALYAAALTGKEIVTGVTAYPTRILTEEELAKAGAGDPIFVTGTAQPELMICYEMATDENEPGEAEFPMPLIVNGQYTTWLKVNYPILKTLGHFPKYKAYRVSDLPNLHGVKEIQGCAMGALLIERKVLEKICFRNSQRSSSMQDYLFCMDARKAGFHIYCDFDVRPEHHAKLDQAIFPDQMPIIREIRKKAA